MQEHKSHVFLDARHWRQQDFTAAFLQQKQCPSSLAFFLYEKVISAVGPATTIPKNIMPNIDPIVGAMYASSEIYASLN